MDNGTPISKPTNPTKDNYVFFDWYADEALTQIFDFNTLIKNDLTLYAKWTNPIKITFQAQNGYTMPTQTIAQGKTITQPNDPNPNAGFVFDDWYANANYTTKFNFNNPLTTDTTIYIKFVPGFKLVIDNGTVKNTPIATYKIDIKINGTLDATRSVEGYTSNTFTYKNPTLTGSEAITYRIVARRADGRDIGDYPGTNNINGSRETGGASNTIPDQWASLTLSADPIPVSMNRIGFAYFIYANLAQTLYDRYASESGRDYRTAEQKTQNQIPSNNFIADIIDVQIKRTTDANFVLLCSVSLTIIPEMNVDEFHMTRPCTLRRSGIIVNRVAAIEQEGAMLRLQWAPAKLPPVMRVSTSFGPIEWKENDTLRIHAENLLKDYPSPFWTQNSDGTWTYQP